MPSKYVYEIWKCLPNTIHKDMIMCIYTHRLGLYHIFGHKTEVFIGPVSILHLLHIYPYVLGSTNKI